MTEKLLTVVTQQMFTDPVYSVPIHSIFSSCLCQSLEIIHLFMIQPDQYQYHSQIRATYVLVNLSIHKGIKDSHIRIKSEMLFLKTPIITAAYNNLITFQVSKQFTWKYTSRTAPQLWKSVTQGYCDPCLCLSICYFSHYLTTSKDLLSDCIQMGHVIIAPIPRDPDKPQINTHHRSTLMGIYKQHSNTRGNSKTTDQHSWEFINHRSTLMG